MAIYYWFVCKETYTGEMVERLHIGRKESSGHMIGIVEECFKLTEIFHQERLFEKRL